MAISGVAVRSWRPADIPSIACILAGGWRQAYGAFMPPEVLASRADPDHRTQEIGGWLTGDFDPAGEALLVAETRAGVQGFVAIRLGDKEGLGTAGYVPLLYVDAAAQRQGLGAALLLAGLDWLEARAPGALAIPAFAQNPYRGFYDAIGGTVAKTVTAKVDDHAFAVVQYFWPSLDAVRRGIRARPRLRSL